MVLGLFGFLHMSLVDILDILLTAVIIFLMFRWLRGSAALSIFMAIISLYIIRFLVGALNMKILYTIMSTVLDVGMIAMIVIFQPEIRRVLTNLGNRYITTTDRSNLMRRIFGRQPEAMGGQAVNEITEACRRMSEDRTGALIVIERTTSLAHIISTGDRIDADIHRRLLQNLFFKNSPLHDGAVVIGDGRIVAARCTLPITEKTDIPARYGMRHKAAIGITEVSDATVVLVSEETGTICFVREGQVTEIKNINELKLLLGSSAEGRKKE